MRSILSVVAVIRDLRGTPEHGVTGFKLTPVSFLRNVWRNREAA
jgi:hypothetical protein